MAINVVPFSFSWCSIGGPGSRDMFTFQHLLTNWSGLQTPSGVPRAPSTGRWLSLPHLLANFSGPQLTDFLSSPSYIIVQSPTLYLWNGMFDRHQVEITVMQFTGHSLPVHQSMSVPWDFYLVLFFQPSPPTRFLLVPAIGICHFLPVHHIGMACLAGSKVNIQQAPLHYPYSQIHSQTGD